MIKRFRGFTLIELMVTLAVLAIVLGIAIPSFKEQIANSRSLAIGDEFASALNYARSHAVKTAGRVSICASSNGVSCTGNWTDGFLVFEDKASTDIATNVTIGSVYKVWPKLDASGSFSVKRGSNDAAFIRYTSLGALAPIDNQSVTINIKLDGCSGKSARKISIGFSGLVSVSNESC